MLTLLFIIAFWVCVFCLLSSWLFYPLLIIGLARWKKHDVPRSVSDHQKPFLSFIVVAYNEEQKIVPRIENLRELSGGYPMEIIVGSDGSNDCTVQMVNSLNYPDVKVIDFPERRGRALVHNDCAMKAKGDILIFTDAETVFAPDFVELLIPCFRNPSVGAVSGRIFYMNKTASSIGHSASLYWQYEELMRTSESKLGILGFGTGAALAMCKEAFEPIRQTEDIDFAATLAAVGRGYSIRYEPGAQAFDYISETASAAFRTRIRQTSRCFKSVIRRIFRTPILVSQPGVFIAALLHKTLRHLTPFFMAFLLMFNSFLLGRGRIYDGFFLMQLLFYTLAGVGYCLEKQVNRPFRIFFSLPFHLVLLNVSRGIGVIKALMGRETAIYRTTR